MNCFIVVCLSTCKLFVKLKIYSCFILLLIIPSATLGQLMGFVLGYDASTGHVWLSWLDVMKCGVERWRVQWVQQNHEEFKCFCRVGWRTLQVLWFLCCFMTFHYLCFVASTDELTAARRVFNAHGQNVENYSRFHRDSE